MTITTDLAYRLQACESELEAQRGYLKAMEYGIRAAVISHPTPAALASVWREILPAIADAHFEASPLFSASLRQGLALLTEQIEDAAVPR